MQISVYFDRPKQSDRINIHSIKFKVLIAMIKTILVILFSFSLLSLSISTLNAHSGAHPVRYVSAIGKDAGVCNLPESPCHTIAYAVNQASKGDKVHVAVGVYSLQGLDVFFLLSDMVEIKGGFSANFKSYDPQNFASAITGIPAEYRERLASRGFRLIRDNKNETIKLSIKDRQLLDKYQKITQKIEGKIECVNGTAGNFECHNIDMQSHIPLNELSTNPSSANDIWGFVDLNNNKEYAIIGLRNATAVIDISDPNLPIEVGSINGVNSTWRDIKVYQFFDASLNRYKAYAYVSTEASQGLQVLDLTNLPNSVTLANTMTEFASAHNVYLANINYADGTVLPSMQAYLYVAGSNKGAGAYRIFNLKDPINPALEAAPIIGAGYIHDATSLLITDARTSDCANQQNPCELFIDFNERTVDIWDMSDKSAPNKLSSTSYGNAGYIHSGWWSEDKKTIFIQDELDELTWGLKTTMRAMDISDLKNPFIIGTYEGQTNAIDHNGFTLNNYYYMSNYRRGLSVIDVSDPANMQDIAFFDTFAVPQENTPHFNGAWGTYPYLPSGNILVSDIEYGLFVLKLNQNDGAFPKNDSTQTPPPPKKSGGGGDAFLILFLIANFIIRRQSLIVKRN